jgi:hypothetical protein
MIESLVGRIIVQTRVPSDQPFRCRHESVVTASLVGSPEEEKMGINLVNCSTTLSLSKITQLKKKKRKPIHDEIERLSKPTVLVHSRYYPTLYKTGSNSNSDPQLSTLAGYDKITSVKLSAWGFFIFAPGSRPELWVTSRLPPPKYAPWSPIPLVFVDQDN